MASRELQQELALANRRIIEIRAQIDRQRKLVLRLEAAGHDATEAKSLLHVVEWILEALEEHREQVLQEVPNAMGEER
jgi:hypothetical protein